MKILINAYACSPINHEHIVEIGKSAVNSI